MKVNRPENRADALLSTEGCIFLVEPLTTEFGVSHLWVGHVAAELGLCRTFPTVSDPCGKVSS